MIRGMRAHHALLAVAGLGAAAVLPATAATGARSAKVRPVIVADARGDARTGVPDLVRVRMDRASDGRVRAILSLAEEFVGKDLLADKDSSGPPGSLCLRLWTAAKPGLAPPDYLVCLTADADGRLRASVTQERPNDTPVRVGAATVSRPSTRAVTLRFSQSAIRRPKAVTFAAESTRPGCARTSCVDTAPDAPKTARLTLRSSR
jgi:hypothetical protein